MDLIDHELSRKVCKTLAPPPRLKVSQWADSHRRLSPEASAEPGKWDTNRAPYQREPMDTVNEDGVERTVLMWGAQVGKTEVMLNVVGYFIDYDPSPIMGIQPTLELAEAFSKDRISPMIRDTPTLGAKVKDPRARDSGNTLLHKKFTGGHLTLAGANSPASLASRPIRVVITDEVDRYPKSAGTEGDPVKLAQKRAKTFFNRVLIEMSTPTIQGQSRIEQSFLESDQRRYYVPCPLCEHKQVLKWGQIKYEKDSAGGPINVRYECECCRGTFDDGEKDWMLLNGEWRAGAPFKGIAGFHINELYSPWVRWRETVVDFLESVNDPEKLKTWVNTALGETWQEKGEAPEWEKLYRRREKYSTNVVPWGGLFLTGGVDVQKDRLELEVIAWGRDKQSWSVDYRVFQGDTADLSDSGPWAALDKVLDEQWVHESGLMMPLRMLAVDSGFNTQHVYSWARRHPPNRVMVIKGSDKAPVFLAQPKPVDITIKGVKIRRGLRLWSIGVGIGKTELYSWLRLDPPIDGDSFPPGFCHFPEYGPDHFKQLTAETLVTKVVKGYPRFEWKKTQERNEALDCRIYGRAAAAAVGMDRYSSAQWDALESEVGTPPPKGTKSEPAKPQAQRTLNKPAPKPRRRNRESSIW